MEQHYFPPLHGMIACSQCEAQDCRCRGLYQRNRRDIPYASGRCPRLPDLCGFVEKSERADYMAAFVLIHAELGLGGLILLVTLPGQKRYRKVYQAKSGYWYYKTKNENGDPERIVLQIEGYRTKADILWHMNDQSTDYCLFRCDVMDYCV